MRQKRRSYRDDDDDDPIGDDLAAINDRLDELTRHLERVAPRASSRRAEEDRADKESDRVSEALARLDRRLDQVIAEARSAPIEAQRRALEMMPLAAVPVAPPPPPAPIAAPPPAPAPVAAQPTTPNWAAEISARQRALDGSAAPAMRPRAQAAHAPAYAPAPAPIYAPSQDLSALELHLRQITAQIASLHQPYENAITALRTDLAEVGRALKDAMPRHAVEALEGEVRSLSERIGRSRQAGGDPAALGGLEQGLAEVRDALRNLAPAENLIGFEDAVRGLSHKIDQLGAAPIAPEPAVFHQLEEAIAAMRHVGSHVASDGALAQLAAEVHGLAARFERATEENSGSEVLARLESRIAAMMESGRSVPPDLEHAMHALSERLEHIQMSQQQLTQGDQHALQNLESRIAQLAERLEHIQVSQQQLSQGDHTALHGLEDRIVKLVERLDSYDSKLGNLDAIGRGMADVLVHLEEMRKANARRPVLAVPEAPPAEAAPLPPAPQLRAEPPAAAPPVPADVFDAPPAPVAPPPPPPAPPAQARTAPPQPQQRRPIDPNLPPDTPLEPGSGVPRGKPGSPAARIAASEAALGGMRSSMADVGGKSAAIIAARNAAMAYQAEEPVKAPRKSLFAWFKSRKPKEPKPPKPPKAPKEAKPPKPATVVAPIEPADPNAPPPPTLRQKIFKHVKTLIIAISVVIIILGTLQTAVDFFMAPPEVAQPQDTTPAPAEGRAPDAPQTAPSTAPGRAMPTPDSMPPAGPAPDPNAEPAADPDPTGAIGPRSMFDPNTVLTIPRAPDVTGSIPRQTPKQAPTDPATAGLPASFGATLRTAAATGHHGAEYEIGLRYAEGRGVPRNMDEAVRWLQRAAAAGFAPAQFRLAGIHEKGDGVKKDLAAARRLYLTAAEKGHAKAMHNLAVLHAEGIDGKPDYRVAAQWFRKAAGYGVADSQFNLAILYARGIGIEQNLAESYKWFALAAIGGDQDAGRKRDEVAARLDQQSLMAARLATQTFIVQKEPDEATSLKLPPGGWDATAAAAEPAKPRTRARTTARP